MTSKKQIVASALIPDSLGRIFVQKRTMTRRLFPGCWDLIGGHVDEGEDVLSALNREIEEETGWKLKSVIEELTTKPWRSGETEYEERQFIVTIDGDLERPSLETAKVSEGLWVDRKNIERLKENREPGDQLIYDSVLEALDVLEKRRSSTG
ncbi:NUDIX domain-containing protein [Bradyrhizobium arachidis]|uniref:NUDIX domain-containing protein n=1 Tax=Bradyrhizobium arachidis TaxID=858423 RepID=UPI002162CD4D|nr:NUDIX domain-containing protein [Bradyrhizobium arachidis]UVO30156.1 NUDIX domain-containing protein [Bradyrhizobium arachidis]